MEVENVEEGEGKGREGEEEEGGGSVSGVATGCCGCADDGASPTGPVLVL